MWGSHECYVDTHSARGLQACPAFENWESAVELKDRGRSPTHVFLASGEAQAGPLGQLVLHGPRSPSCPAQNPAVLTSTWSSLPYPGPCRSVPGWVRQQGACWKEPANCAGGQPRCEGHPLPSPNPNSGSEAPSLVPPGHCVAGSGRAGLGAGGRWGDCPQSQRPQELTLVHCPPFPPASCSAQTSVGRLTWRVICSSFPSS